MQEQIDALESGAKTYFSTTSTKMNELRGKNSKLRDEVKELKSENYNLTDEVTELKNENSNLTI